MSEIISYTYGEVLNSPLPQVADSVSKTLSLPGEPNFCGDLSFTVDSDANFFLAIKDGQLVFDTNQVDD